VHLSLLALTCIDPVTNLVELFRLDNKTSEHVSSRFENGWIARYPRPVACVYDPGTEFKGLPFQQVLHRNGIQPRPTTVKNPQANSICERMHGTVGNILRNLLNAHVPKTAAQVNDILDSVLATVSYALRVAVHNTLRASPGAIIFQRDMLLDISTHRGP